MRKFILLLIVAIGMVLPGAAQSRKGTSARAAVSSEMKADLAHGEKDLTKDLKKDRAAMRKEMREFKLKFLAQEMDLNQAQRKQFAEVYSRMSDEKHKLFHETRDLEKKINSEKEVSEEQYAEVSRALTEAKAKDAAIEQKYDAEFAKFLSAKQIFKMKSAEEKFRRRMEEMRGAKKKKSVPTKK